MTDKWVIISVVMKMNKRTTRLVAAISVVLLLAGAVAVYNSMRNRYLKYSDSFFDAFNTVTIVVGYAKNEQQFDSYFDMIHDRFDELHRLYDIYNAYEGVNNIKTINDNAGIMPVKVDREIIDLILFARDWCRRTSGRTNIAMGSVLSIWHEYREEGIFHPEAAEIPPMEQLREAAKHTDMDRVIVDEGNSTVYLADPNMRLDVGAVAKGYATEVVAREVMAAGLQSGMISAGGNVRAIGKPFDGIRERWGVGIQDPDQSIVSDEGLLDVVFVKDASVVSSGDYQRYYIVNGKVLHHIIDPTTLMPADHYRAVTVVTEDSGLADFLSTELFLLPYDEASALAAGLDGVEALWVMPDGEVRTSEGMGAMMRSLGATGAK